MQQELSEKCRSFLSRWKGTLLIFLTLSLVSGCERGKASASKDEPSEPALRVKTCAVEEAFVERVVRATGSLAAQEQADLSVKAPGRVESIKIDLGSRVEKGDMIAQVERRDYELRVRQSEAMLAQARARLGVGSSRVDLQACKLEYSIVSPK